MIIFYVGYCYNRYTDMFADLEMVSRSKDDEAENSQRLSSTDASRFRGLAARANYLAATVRI